MLISNAQRLALTRIAAWILVALLVAVTLVPIGLRPVVTANPSIERIAAYALTGLLMTLGYPRHWFWILLGGVALAGGLEAGQTLTGTRHGRVDDFLVKAAAALVGTAAARGLEFLPGWPQTGRTSG